MLSDFSQKCKHFLQLPKANSQNPTKSLSLFKVLIPFSTVGIILGPNSSSLTQLTPISSGMSGDMKPVLPQSGALIDPSTTEAYPGKSHGKKKVDFTDPVSFFKFTPISQSYEDRVTKFQLFCNFLQTRWSCSIWVGKGPFLVPTKFVVRSWCNFLCTNKILELPVFFWVMVITWFLVDEHHLLILLRRSPHWCFTETYPYLPNLIASISYLFAFACRNIHLLILAWFCLTPFF